MRAIFSIKGLLMIWIVITGSIALVEQLHGLADELRRSSESSATLINGVYTWINGEATGLGRAILDYFKIDPNQLAIDVHGSITLQVQYKYVLFAVGVLLWLPAIWVYNRAVKSKEFADDFLALLFFYMFIVTGLTVALGLGFQVAAAVQRGWVLGAFIVIIIALSLKAGALKDSKIFFRGILEIAMLALLLFPHETIYGVSFLLDGLANLATSLKSSVNGYLFWAAIAILLALGQLYGIGPSAPEKKPDHLGQVIGDLEGVAAAARKGHGKKDTEKKSG